MRQKSLPVQGAWIEIGGSNDFNRWMASLPVQGAWIEMQTVNK